MDCVSDATAMMDLRARVAAAVGSVQDPHLWVGLSQMGMIGSIDVDEVTGRVDIGLVYPCIGCPAVELIESAVKRRVSELHGVTDVCVKAVWSRVWSKHDMDPDAIERLKEFGVQV